MYHGLCCSSLNTMWISAIVIPRICSTSSLVTSGLRDSWTKVFRWVFTLLMSILSQTFLIHLVDQGSTVFTQDQMFFLGWSDLDGLLSFMVVSTFLSFLDRIFIWVGRHSSEPDSSLFVVSVVSSMERVQYLFKEEINIFGTVGDLTMFLQENPFYTSLFFLLTPLPWHILSFGLERSSFGLDKRGI